MTLLPLAIPLKREVVLNGAGPATHEGVTLKEILDGARSQLSKATLEQIWAVFFNMQGGLIGSFLLGEGDALMAALSPRRLFQAALKTNATGMILLHNHLAPDASPSEHDISTTEKIKELLGWINVELVDHIIVAEDGSMCAILDQIDLEKGVAK